MIEEEKMVDEQKVIIAGGGPAGLLTSILFSNIGIQSTVLERATEPDQWSTRSYTIEFSSDCLRTREDRHREKSPKRKWLHKEYILLIKNMAFIKDSPLKESLFAPREHLLPRLTECRVGCPLVRSLK